MRRTSTPDASEAVEEADQHQQQPARNCQVKKHRKKTALLADATNAENLCLENVVQAQSVCTQAVGQVDDKELGYCVFLLQAKIAFFHMHFLYQ